MRAAFWSCVVFELWFACGSRCSAEPAKAKGAQQNRVEILADGGQNRNESRDTAERGRLAGVFIPLWPAGN